jgi:hypothetical protein
MIANDTPPLPPNDGLEWLRAIRRKLAAEANHDPAEKGRRLRERERKMAERLFKTQRGLVAATRRVETPS